MLGELLQIDNVETILEELEERHLVRAHASSTRLHGRVQMPDMPKTSGRNFAIVRPHKTHTAITNTNSICIPELCPGEDAEFVCVLPRLADGEGPACG